MKAAGALQITRIGNGKRLIALSVAMYLLALLLAPAAVAAYRSGEIDLELDKTAQPLVVEMGDSVTWTITVSNDGTGDATGVEIGDILPDGLTYLSHSGDGSLNPTDGTWTVGAVAVGGSATVEIETSVHVLGDIVNEAEVTMADQEDIDSIPGDGEGDDWDDAVITVVPTGGEVIDLELTKSADPIDLTLGDETTWTVDLVNQGPDDATGVEVAVAVPAGVTYVSHSGAGSFEPTTGTWAVGDLAAGATVTVAITTTVDVLGDITCSAEVTMADQEDIDSIPGDGEGDDWDDATVTVKPTGGELIDLELTKSADPTSVLVGESTTWTVDLVNQGPDDATGVEVTVTPPAGVTYMSHSGTGSYDTASGVWVVGQLAAGATVTLQIVTSVDAIGSWTCEAEVTMADQEDIDSIPGDGEGDDWDDATVVATADGDELIDLELTKTVDPGQASLGDEITWTVLLTNKGPDDATGVEVTVTPPAGVTYVSHLGLGDFDPGTGIWNVGDLALDAVVTLEIVTTVDSEGTWTCEAEVTKADQNDVDSIPGDGEGDDWDDATVIMDPGGSAGIIDLELLKSATPILLAVGDSTTWKVDLTNQGPDPATGVVVAVTPPGAVTYESHSGDGEFAPETGIWTVGDLAAGAAVSLMIVTTVDEVGTWTCVAEVVAADQEDIDSIPDDGEGDDWDDATVEASIVLASSIIGDTVWLDEDADGSQDAGEPGISGAIVVLTNVDSGALATQVTNADGLYLFSALEPGNYSAAIDMSTVDSKLGLTTAGSFSIGLADNEAFLTADFGLAETLPVTGFDPVPFAVAGLILMLLGAVALELTWPEREGRRIFSLGQSS